MIVPTFIDRKVAAQLAAPDETHAVRVILQKVANPGAYRLRCRLRSYLFERNPDVRAHALDIPVSLWMQGVPKPGQPANRNTSISDDLKPTAQLPLVIQIVPWKGATGRMGKTAVELIESIVAKFNPPPELRKALQLAKAGDLATLESMARVVPVPEPPEVVPPAAEAAEAEETPAQAKARKMREAKAAKKAEREAANLQPAQA